MEQNNYNLLKKILLTIVLIVIGLIIFVLIKNSIAFKNYDDNYIKESTIIIKEDLVIYKNLSNTEKINLNQKYNNLDYLFAFNNIIINYPNYLNVNLLESYDSRFIFVYSMLYKENNNITFEILNQKSKDVFGTNFEVNDISKFYGNNAYNYDVKDNKYCLKFIEKSNNEENNLLKFVLIEYNEKVCDYNYIDDIDKENLKIGVLSIKDNHIKSLIFIK